MVTLLVGEFSFLDVKNDGKHEAIIHKIDKCFQCDSIEEAEELGESLLSDYASYLVPESYKGSINLKEMESAGYELQAQNKKLMEENYELSYMLGYIYAKLEVLSNDARSKIDLLIDKYELKKQSNERRTN